MRAIWKGSISFGLVNIPVSVCGAVEAKQVSFNQIHEPCKSRIKYQKYCPHCDLEVTAEEIIKGYQTFDGIIAVNPEDLAAIPLPSLKTLELDGFIKEKKVDPMFYQKPYYLLPNKSDQAYWLLYRRITRTGYKEALVEMLNKKQPEVVRQEVTGEVTDLMEVLKKSIEKDKENQKSA